ncbi:MAG TPA: hypothetical protein VEA18_01670, partial [Candidatus Kapabacteria bacterium]|nr:hypothetical protein [Candidatus Kapabacteria bacterium]
MRKPLSVFGRVWDASGVRNFDGNAWWYHSFMPGLDFSGATFVAKTTTIDPRKGNMPLKKDGITPRDLFPSCIKVYPRKGIALNAVGLSGHGAEALLK